MAGFFTAKEVTNPLVGRGLTCVSCGLYTKVKTPNMKPQGQYKKKILIVAEAPSYKDDKAGKPFQDSIGVFLRNSLAKHNIDLERDC